ncbi:glycosyltransferase family 87 protein [Terrabacter sp. 2RAF25]|uniref:glycosyltransferase family 87 protein n=1 Tax=Terrabacter sp. 2RAF25 TaxID=3232998 RepID=UPI003F9A94D6
MANADDTARRLRGRWVTWAAWAAAVAVLLVQAVRVRSFWYYGTDIEATWDGARNLWQHGDPYIPVAGHSPFVYPPSAALLFSPAALVENRLFVLCGLALTMVAALALATSLSSLLGAGWRSPLAAALLAVTVVSSVGTETLGYSNLSWSIAALAGWTLVAAQRGRWVLVAVMVGLAVAIKPMVVTLGLVLLARRRFRELVLAAAIPLVLNLATIPLLRDPADFVTRVLPRVLSGSTTGVGSNPSIWAVGQRHGLEASLVWGLRGLVLAATALLVVAALLRRPPGDLATVGLASAAGLMLVVQVNQPSYGLVLLPLAAVLFRVGTAPVRVAVASAAGALLACGTPGWVPTDVTTLGVVVLLAAAAFVTFDVRAVARDHQPVHESGAAAGPVSRDIAPQTG